MNTLKYSSLIVLFLSGTLLAAPNLLRFQGRLTNVDGTPIPGQPHVRFKIFNHPTSDSLVWEQVGHTPVNSNDNGLFSTNIDVPSNIFNTSDSLYLEVLVHAGGTDQAMLPRQQLTSVPYAFGSAHADQADLAVTVTDGSITSNKIANGAVMKSNIADNAVGALQIEDGSVSFLEIAPNAVRSEHIQDEGVEFIDLATDAVTSDNIQDGSIQNTDLAPESVTGETIRNNSILEEDLTQGSVTSDVIQDQTIREEDIQDNAVSPEKISAGYGLVPSGAVLMFNRACPTEGWTYLSDMNGHIPMGIAPGSYTGNQQGSWVLSGITTQQSGSHNHIVNSHTHDLRGHTHLVERELAMIRTGNFPTVQPKVPTDPFNDNFYPTSGPNHNSSGSSSPTTDLHAGHNHGVSSNGQWRPAHIGLIFCVKN